MKRAVLLTVAFIWATVLLLAEDISKYSASTQMFLSERKGETRLPRLRERSTHEAELTQAPFIDLALAKEPNVRPIAEVETVNGIEMISAFVQVTDGNFSSIIAMGGVIEKQFGKLATMLLPADKLADISDLSNVVKIEVAEILKPLNDRQRTVTQTLDAITNSTAAQALGITSGYTGKGVILGMIDTGIDFQHIAFKDVNGNSRIKRAYKLSSSNSTSLTTYSTSSQISALTYDTNAEDHGTHTSTTAGGSSVIVNGSTVTVTNDHANATYGGMAPEVDLVIAGLSSLYTTSIATAIGNICEYADTQNEPCVLSLSLGSQVGAHDGTGTIADVINTYAGNNHIIVYAASNDAMRANDFVDLGTSNGGGMYASGTSTSSKPMIVNVQRSFSDADGNTELYMPTITAYARTASVPLAVKFHVVDTSTGNIVYSSSAYTSSTTISLTGSTGLAQYFKSSSSYTNYYGDKGQIRLIYTQDSSNKKYYWQIYAPIMISTSYSQNASTGIYESKYAFCVSVYPTSTSASTTVDMWEGYASWFGTDLNLSSSSYNYCKGNDECSVSDQSCVDKVISVGAYVTRNSVTDYQGTAHDYSSAYPNIGDHASFSSYQTAGYGPTGKALPTINAPGARIIAGVNHYHTTSVDDYSYYGDDYKADLVVNSTSYPYAAMEGTSMATPCVSGIVALWLQACVEAGKTPTPDYIKEVMEATWDTDQWTAGAGHGAKTFGTHGKINAIKGIQYILGCTSSPMIKANPDALDFGEVYVGDADASKTFTVTGANLTGNVTATLSDADGVFSLSPTAITKAEATAGKTITVTFSPKAAKNYTGTITLSGGGAESVTIALNARGNIYTPAITASSTTVNFSGYATRTYSQTVTVSGSHLEGDITATLKNGAGIYSIDKTSLSKNAANGTLTITYAPTAAGQTTAQVVLSSTNAPDVTITVKGTAQAATPTLTVTPASLSFSSEPDKSDSQSFTVSGRFIDGDVTLSLTDANGVFSINPTVIAAGNIDENAAVNVMVTFSPQADGDYTGTITLSGGSAEDVTVALNANASSGGTAADTYLDIAKYATIDEAGWNTSYVNTLYKYTEYDDAGKAWLTLPVYGAWVGVYYSNHPQKWIQSSLTTSNSYAGKTWTNTPSATAPCNGSSAYFTSTTARAMGYSSIWSTNRTQKAVSFYVSNTTAVQALGIGASGASSTYPAAIKVYKCTKNADGSLTAATTATKSATNTSTSTRNTFTLSVDGLDKSQIYKVEASVYNGYIYEIGFCRTIPSLTVDPAIKQFNTKPGETQTATFTVTGVNLENDVTVALTDYDGGYYTVSPSVIGKADATAGATVTVTYKSDTEGAHDALVTLTSGKASATIPIYGATGNPGSAYSNYLDLANYSSIDKIDWYSSRIDKPYKYTENEEEEVGWLTMPNIMGAYSYVYGDQTWTGISSGNYLIQSTDGGALTWDSNDVFAGSGYYHTSTDSYGFGQSSSTGTTLTGSFFYVTNCKAVKAYGYNSSGVKSSYPSILYVRECTENEDGSLTVADSDAARQTSTTTSSDFVLSIDGLDPAKIYQVVTCGSRSFFYEIGFCTPAPVVYYTLEEVATDEDIVTGRNYRITADDLTAVYVSGDGKTLYCKDDNAYDNPSEIAAGEIDYVTNVAGLMGAPYDQSNWVALELPATSAMTFDRDLVGHKLTGVRGKLLSKGNPAISIDETAMPVADATAAYDRYFDNLNVYLAANFLSEEQTVASGETYFFVAPKPVEVATVTWAMWSEADNCFLVPPKTGKINQAGIEGGFVADFSKFDGTVPTLLDGSVYSFRAIIFKNIPSQSAARRSAVAGDSYVVYPVDSFTRLGSVKDGVVTGLYNTNVAKQVSSVFYVNTLGVTSDKPFDGVNIVVTRYTDGTQSTVKVLK